MPSNPFDNIATLSAIYDEDEGVQQLVDSGQLTTASNINRPEPTARVKQIDLFNNFNTRNPKADGGMLVKRQGFSFGDIVKETKNKLNETITPQQRFVLNNRLKNLAELQQKAKKIKGSNLIKDLILKKDSLGRPHFSAYIETLGVLEDLQNNQYKNSSSYI